MPAGATGPRDIAMPGQATGPDKAAAPREATAPDDAPAPPGAAAPHATQPPRDAAGIRALVAADAAMMAALHAVARHAPPGSWIGAGFLRNAVWDALHGRAPDVAGLADLDVVFHDAADATPARDAAAEAALRAAAPGLPWSVTNQARMHTRNGHAPYAGVADAIAHWPETATAIAARCGPGGVELLAPHGLGDLLALTLRPTPAFAGRADVVRARMAAKGWLTRWPRLVLALGPA